VTKPVWRDEVSSHLSRIPSAFVRDNLRGETCQGLAQRSAATRAPNQSNTASGGDGFEHEGRYANGESLLAAGCRGRGALMPDAHVGYGPADWWGAGY